MGILLKLVPFPPNSLYSEGTTRYNFDKPFKSVCVGVVITDRSKSTEKAGGQQLLTVIKMDLMYFV